MEVNKKHLRAIFKEKRNLLQAEEQIELNASLLSQFKQFIWQGIGYLHVFLPIQKLKEPDTYQLADWLRDDYPEIKLVISKSDLKSNLLDHFLWEKDQMFEINPWGIQEPLSGTLITPSQLDAVIVPLLAFDQAGHRVGYGKGFYDRFLAACRPDCLIIGLSFFGPVKEIGDVSPTDIPLDFCITPERIWNFNRIV